MSYFCGIDIGASAAKLVIIDECKQLVAKAVRRSGVDYTQAAEACLDESLSAVGIRRGQLSGIIATGYGRDNVPWATDTMTEIACHAKGAYCQFPQEMTVVDIGAQDNKIIYLNAAGQRTSFRLNRKCAAGTGSFLEEIALRLDLDIADLNDLAERSTKDLELGSFCTVFAATEILEKIRKGEAVEDIVKGAFRSVVKRILEMGAVTGTLVLTGGVVAHNPILTTLVHERFGRKPLVPRNPQFAGALGAALFASGKPKGGESAC
jgi:predicted CoA-substrate-specific enzyme activase